MADFNIQNANELEFAVFCIENIAAQLGVEGQKVYNALPSKAIF